jgi:hypothetical protein
VLGGFDLLCVRLKISKFSSTEVVKVVRLSGGVKVNLYISTVHFEE